MLPPYANFCKCRSCALYFRAANAFHMHRVGTGNERGCMPAAQLPLCGLELDPEGYWRLPKRAFRNIYLRAVK